MSAADFSTLFSRAPTNNYDPEELKKHRLFEESAYTKDDYAIDCKHFTSIEQYQEKLPLFVAVVGGGFVLKVKDIINNFVVPKYEFFTSWELGRDTFNSVIRLEETQTIESKKGRTTKTVIVEYKPMKWLNDVEFKKNLATYSGMSLVSKDPHFLQTFIEPRLSLVNLSEENIPMCMTMIKSLLADFRECVLNPEAYDELINTFAYKTRHMEENICKSFICYSQRGGTGKSALSKLLSWAFWGFTNISITDEQTEGKFNGHLENDFMTWGEEWERSTIKTKAIETFIKRITTGTMSFENKGVDVKAGEYKGIFGFNTNQPDLYGMLRTNDTALKDRLVISVFKEDARTKSEWVELFKKYGIEKGNPYLIRNRYLIGAALHYYLLHEHVIPDSFNPERYISESKTEIIERLRGLSVGGADPFLNWLASENNPFINHVWGKLGERKGKEFFNIQASAIDVAFQQLK